MDEQLGLLVGLVAFPTFLAGILGIIGSILLFVFAVIGLVSGGIVNGIVLMIVAAVSLLLSWIWLFIAGGVRRHARWAYVVTAIVYLVPSVPWLFGAVDLPPEYAALPEVFFTIQTIFVFIYLAVGICAAFLLILSFMDADSAEQSTSTEAG